MNTKLAYRVEHHELSPEATRVRDVLVANGLETPMKDSGLTSQQKYERIKHLMTDVVNT